MSAQRKYFVYALLLMLSSAAQCRHPFDFFDESIEDFVDCLLKHNITHTEYEQFESYENKQNLLANKLELKYKCNVDCQLQRQPMKWLTAAGRLDLQLLNATDEAAASIVDCMANADAEQCAYSFKLVMCAYLANHPPPDELEPSNYEAEDAEETDEFYLDDGVTDNNETIEY
ncbi:general odorant-binding protein 57b-like [Drosophila busckii]|uniref:general odorant-binding protein 57b-like n=1 Tax=Drosophila busckii TaxID=30019 RepID=UPI00083F2542|nr:general odorant-binding protein 57b-like [Drosophila busckii]